MFTRFCKNFTILFSPRYLVYTNATIGSTFLVSGYTAAQKLRCFLNGNDNSDLTPTKLSNIIELSKVFHIFLEMLTCLGAFNGMYQTFAYRYIDRIKYRKAIFIKLLLDQLILAPVSVSTFLFGNLVF